MYLTRREFLEALAAAMATGLSASPHTALAGPASIEKMGLPANYYELAPFGNVSLLHFTDCHAQLLPSYYREPDMHLGIGSMYDKVPHLVGQYLLDKFKIASKTVVQAQENLSKSGHVHQQF